MKKLHNILNDLFQTDKKLLFVFICLFAFLLLLLKKNLIESEVAAFEILEQKGQSGFLHLISALQFFSIPIIYLWKFLFTTFVIWIGCFLFGYRVTFSQCWGIVMVAELIFFLPEVLKIIHFTFIQTDPDIFEVRTYYPAALINFFDPETLTPKWHYPLKSLNLFEILYWFLLIQLLHLKIRKTAQIAAAVISTSYILAFLVWLGYWLIINS